MSAKKEKSIILLHGMFDKGAFDILCQRKSSSIYVLEGRPSLGSGRHCSAELLKRNIKPTLIADNMAGFLFFRKMVKEVWLAYHTADNNGGVCQVGGLILAVLGKRHHVPVYLYPAIEKSDLMGKEKDLFQFNGVRVVPSGVRGYVPLVDWVPQKYITKMYPAFSIV